jgi:predicted nucleic acid-binding protein
VDADVLMNLLATGCATEILRALELTLLAGATVSGELLYLESREVTGQREQIDFTPAEEAGVLNKVILEDRELGLVIALAQLVDDGEAEVIAIALTRGIVMATDDRKARRIALERGASLLSTPELLHRWQDLSSVPAQRMTHVLKLVNRRSRYRPPTTHSLYDWWMSLLTRS